MHQKNLLYFLLFSFLTFSQSCQKEPSVMKIAFGSCGWQDHPLPIFNEVVKHNPDLFIFLGDNIYGDTKIMDTLRAKYNRLGAKESFQNLKMKLIYQYIQYVNYFLRSKYLLQIYFYLENLQNEKEKFQIE